MKHKQDKLLTPEIKQQVQDLLNNIESGDLTKSRQLIGDLNKARENSLFEELGKLTRELHDALKGIDIGAHDQQLLGVKDKLNYVMTLTEEAATKTMDGIEATIPIADQLSVQAQTLKKEWGRFQRRELSLAEFKELYEEMMVFLDATSESSGTIHAKLQAVVLAQNYQDLSGQAIKKVMTSVSDLEDRLVKLISLAAETGHEIEPQQETETDTKGQERVSNQDEVDDLLSSLGF